MKNNSIFKQIPLITNASMTTSVVSDPIDMTGVEGVAIQAVFTGAPSGTVKIRASIDQVTWTDVRAAVVNISAAGDVLWNIGKVHAPYLMFQYVRDSGTGTLNVTAYQKQQ